MSPGCLDQKDGRRSIRLKATPSHTMSQANQPPPTPPQKETHLEFFFSLQILTSFQNLFAFVHSSETLGRCVLHFVYHLQLVSVVGPVCQALTYSALVGVELPLS